MAKLKIKGFSDSDALLYKLYLEILITGFISASVILPFRAVQFARFITAAVNL